MGGGGVLAMLKQVENLFFVWLIHEVKKKKGGGSFEVFNMGACN